MNMRFGITIAALLLIGILAYAILPKVSAAPAPTKAGIAISDGGTVSTMLVGKWRSQQDSKFVREIKADGVIYDSYEGDPTPGVGGSWSVADLTKDKIEGVPMDKLSGMTIIKAVWENGSITTYFGINTLTNTFLKITDLTGKGGLSSFEKAK